MVPTWPCSRTTSTHGCRWQEPGSGKGAGGALDIRVGAGGQRGRAGAQGDGHMRSWNINPSPGKGSMLREVLGEKAGAGVATKRNTGSPGPRPLSVGMCLSLPKVRC